MLLYFDNWTYSDLRYLFTHLFPSLRFSHKKRLSLEDLSFTINRIHLRHYLRGLLSVSSHRLCSVRGGAFPRLSLLHSSITSFSYLSFRSLSFPVYRNWTFLSSLHSSLTRVSFGLYRSYGRGTAYCRGTIWLTRYRSRFLLRFLLVSVLGGLLLGLSIPWVELGPWYTL